MFHVSCLHVSVAACPPHPPFLTSIRPPLHFPALTSGGPTAGCGATVKLHRGTPSQAIGPPRELDTIGRYKTGLCHPPGSGDRDAARRRLPRPATPCPFRDRPVRDRPLHA